MIKAILLSILFSAPAAFAATNLPSQVACEITRSQPGAPNYFQYSFELQWPSANQQIVAVPGTNSVVHVWIYDNSKPGGPDARYFNIDIEDRRGQLISRSSADIIMSDADQTLSSYIAPIDTAIYCTTHK